MEAYSLLRKQQSTEREWLEREIWPHASIDSSLPRSYFKMAAEDVGDKYDNTFSTDQAYHFVRYHHVRLL